MTAPLRIIFEHAHFLIINKPAGVSMHGGSDTPTVMESLHNMGYHGSLKLVHRLDTPTSGIMVIATQPQAAATLAEAFAQRRVSKYYLAVSSAKPKKKQGHILGDMAAARRGSYKLLKSTENPAYTQFMSHSIDSGYRLFILRPLTGKTHQLRVALRSLGSPIVGDGRYGGQTADRLHLHACALGFKYEGERFDFYQPPDAGTWFLRDETRAIVEALGHPSDILWPKLLWPR
ncbi:TIGR01621 family pseudouridine synthase [Alteromonas oceanisediminis]|uniref:TIGR01621 family pseudouridine synthase n=1 Tax=Alteromonas oceanisediminis TaxID=2836180 RepID=UPI001BDA5C23|nr:TIGR01621 family pseudouridine synthase [Alteromonas oceanisediminis]MBT0584835.1 TIGR01621 family pseudouridine synthase [Alteromonas oceanisediminis]